MGFVSLDHSGHLDSLLSKANEALRMGSELGNVSAMALQSSMVYCQISAT